MFCSNCGSKVVDGAKFCSACGKPIKLPTMVPAQAPKEEETLLLENEQQQVKAESVTITPYVAPAPVLEEPEEKTEMFSEEPEEKTEMFSEEPEEKTEMFSEEPEEKTEMFEAQPVPVQSVPVQPVQPVPVQPVQPVQSVQPVQAQPVKQETFEPRKAALENANVVKFSSPITETEPLNAPIKPIESQYVSNSYNQPITPPKKKKKKGNGGLVAVIIILIVLLIAILGIGSYFLFLDKDGDWYILSDSKTSKDDDKKKEKEEKEDEKDTDSKDDKTEDGEEVADAEEAVADDSEEPWTPPEVIDGIDTENGTPLEYFNPAEHTYQLLYGDMTWSEASRACEKNDNGHLSCIICYEEIEIVEQYLKDLGIDKCEEPYVIWLGAYKDNNGYNWVSGEGVGVSNWKNGEPTNGPDENYIVMQYEPESDSWKWMDVPSDITDEYAGHIAYLCEWEKKAN